MSDLPCAATPQEIDAIKRECWCPGCPRCAFLRDWLGWKWCGRHWWRNVGERSSPWFYVRTTRVF